MMSEVMYPMLPVFPHMLWKDKDYGIEFDVLGNHSRLQSKVGVHTKHYSKRKDAVILDEPLAELKKYRSS